MGVLGKVVRVLVMCVSVLRVFIMRVAVMPIAMRLRPVSALVDPAADVGGLAPRIEQGSAEQSVGRKAGASNHITPAKVLETAKWIKDGKIYKLGHDYEASMPLFGKRVFTLRIPGSPTGGPFGENRLVYHDEFVTTEIGQVGTQFDYLGHIGIAMGAPGDKAQRPYGCGFRRRLWPQEARRRALQAAVHARPSRRHGPGEGPHDGGRRGN